MLYSAVLFSLEECSMSRNCVLVPIAATVAMTSFGVAQNATTSLRGVILDPSGAVVPGAAI